MIESSLHDVGVELYMHIIYFYITLHSLPYLFFKCIALGIIEKIRLPHGTGINVPPGSLFFFLVTIVTDTRTHVAFTAVSHFLAQ